MAYFGIPAWMAMNGKTPGEIGSFVAAVGLPWSFKLVVAPLMDRFSFLPMGRRRPWVLIGQLGLIISFIAMAFVPDPLNNLWLLTLSGFSVACFGAFQDVATDGMAIDIVPIHQQARANGFMWGSKIMGTSASLSLGSWLLTEYNFTVAILSLSIIVAVIMFVPIFLRERPGEKFLPWTKGAASSETAKMQLTNWSDIFKSLYSVFTLRNSLLLGIILFIASMSFNFIATLLPVFTVQALGWTNQQYSQLFSIASLIGGLGGMLIGGILIDKFGKVRMMNIYFFTLIFLTAVFVFGNAMWVNSWFIGAFMMVFQILYVFSSIGLFAIAMQCCWKKVSATQFTIYMTLGNLGRITGAKLIGPAKDQFNWEYTVLLFGAFILVVWIILQFLRINDHLKQVDVLDNNNLEKVESKI